MPALSSCGETAATNSFQGEEHEVAARISNFQKHVTEASQKKICQEDLAASLTRRIETSGKGCEEALKEQLKDVEDLTLTVQDVTVNGKNATATVRSIRNGIAKPSTLALVKEGQAWRISGL